MAGGALRLASSPAMTAARADGINYYGFASEAPLRSSIRDPDGSGSISDRTAVLRLSRLHVTVAGANESGVNRLYALTECAPNSVIDGRCSSRPAIACRASS